MNDFTRSCRVCEQTFDTGGSTTVFCSDRCRRNNPDLPECKWPNCERRARRRGFCSRDSARARLVGNYDDPWVAWDKRVRDSKTYRRAQKPLPRNVENICRVCGSYFMATREVMYCSRPCKDKGKPSSRGLTCRLCDVDMVRSSTSSPQGEAMCLPCRRATSKQREREYMSAYRRKYKARLAMAVSDDYTIDDILDRDGSDCWICERPVDLDLVWPDPMYRSVDHVVPLSKGGHDTLDNVRLSHLRCNATKSDHTDIEEVRSWLRANPSMATS